MTARTPQPTQTAQVGDFTVSLRLHPEVSANIKLKVVAA